MPARRKDSTPPPDSLSLRLGERVVALREEQGLTPPEFAAMVGMNVDYLWRLERGRQNVSFRNVARLAKACDLTLAEFLEGVYIGDVALESRPYVRKPSEPNED